MTDPNGEPRLSGAAFRRRQRPKNIALFLALLAMVALFFAITIVQLGR